MAEIVRSNQETQSSRRDFLAKSAKVAAVAGLVSSAACANARGPKIVVSAGLKPKPITPDTTIGIGLIGVGHRARMLLGEVLKQKNISIKAVADPDGPNQKRALEMIKKGTGDEPEVYGGPEGWKQLLERDDVNAIVSATPCYLHARIYLGCFAAGKHFYGEKPMVIEANDADALVEAQEKNPGITAQIGFQRRATQLYAEGVKRIHEGLIGDPIAGYAAWNLAWGPMGLPGGNRETQGSHTWSWFGRRKYSGDWMLEQACHTWDVFGWATNALPVAASGIGRQDLFKDQDPDRDVTEVYHAHLQYPNGLMIDFEHNWITPKSDKNAKFNGVFERFMGHKGGIVLDEGTFYPREPNAGGPVHYVKPQSSKDGTPLSMQAFFNSLRTGAPVVSGVKNGRMATYVGLLVRKAVYERRWVEMKEIL